MSTAADDRSARHSVPAMARRAAALVNALAAERPDPRGIAATLRAHGETDPLDLTDADVARMRTAAARLREVFAAADTAAAAAALNRLLGARTGPLRLTSHGGASPWHPHLDRDDDAPWDEWFLASSCMALTVLLWDTQQPPGRICASGACGDVFIARGRGPERRYCSRRCATRERVAAHRRARAAVPQDRPGRTGPA